MTKPKICAMTFDGKTWGGWSNSGSINDLKNMEDAVRKVKKHPELGFRIIDADNLVIYVSDMAYAERAVMSAKTNFKVDITDIRLGYPTPPLA